MAIEENNNNSPQSQASPRPEEQTWSAQDEETWSVPTDKLPALQNPAKPVDGAEMDEEATWTIPTSELAPLATSESVDESEKTLPAGPFSSELVDESEKTLPAGPFSSPPANSSFQQEASVAVSPLPSYGSVAGGAPVSGVAFPYAAVPVSGPAPYAAVPTSGPVPYGPPGSFGPRYSGPYTPGRQSFKLNRPLLIALIVVIVLLLGGSLYGFVLHDILSATSAEVKITPASQHMSGQYPMTVQFNTTDATKNAVGAHSISSTSPEKSMTVQATGKGHQNATAGQGTVTVTMLTGSVPAMTALHIPSNSGVNIVIDMVNGLAAGSSQDFSAQAENTGPGGNIGAYDVNNNYYLQSNTSVTFAVHNANGFSGGQDAHDYTYVQQSDIDSVATQLESQMSGADTKAAVLSKLGAGEEFISDIQCNPNVNPNHKANDQANDVTVKVTDVCQGIAYDKQKLLSVIDPQLEQQVISQYGNGYNLDRQLTISIPAGSVNEDDNAKTVAFEADAQGLWIFHVSPAMKHDLASLITGKKQSDATTLLSKQHGVAKSSITTSGGLGTALPTAPENIQIVVLGDQP